MNNDVNVKLHNLAASLSNKYFALMILPTEKCNFRCKYCYEDYQVGRMPSEVVSSIKRFIDRRTDDPELKFLRIGWFGGEPLLEKDIVLDVMSFAKENCGKKGISLLGSMSTNGYFLSGDIFNQLTSLSEWQFQITLDGPKEIHDVTRIMANGKGTFDKIWTNLLSMRENKNNFVVNLRLHVMSKNEEHIRKLIDQIAENFAGDKRFLVFLRSIANLGGENAKNIEVIEKNNLSNVMAELASLLVEKRLNTLVFEDENTGAYICYASSPNRLVIRADGSLAKCTVAFDKDINRVGKINLDGTLSFDHEKLKYWHRGLKTIDRKLLRCPNAIIDNVSMIAKECTDY